MIKRQTTGSIVCPGCDRLVGVMDEKCLICGRSNPGLWGWTPVLQKLGGDLGVTQVVMGGCIVLYLASLLVEPQNIRMTGLFGFLSPGELGVFLLGASGPTPVFGYHRWWTVLSAAWLHGGLLHIGFNMMVLRQFLPMSVQFYGPGRTLIIYTVSSAVGFTLSTASFWAVFLPDVLRTGRFTLGASAPLMGLVGAIFFFTQRGGNQELGQRIRGWLIFIAVLGFMPGLHIDNWAHLGGFLGGYGAARWLDPLRPETTDHLIWGLLCLAANFAAILASIIHGIRLFY